MRQGVMQQKDPLLPYSFLFSRLHEVGHIVVTVQKSLMGVHKTRVVYNNKIFCCGKNFPICSPPCATLGVRPVPLFICRDDRFGCTFYCENQVSNVGVTSLCERCPLLVHLGMAHLKYVTDIGVARLGVGCPILRHLDMTGFVTLSDGMQRDFAFTGVQVCVSSLSTPLIPDEHSNYHLFSCSLARNTKRFSATRRSLTAYWSNLFSVGVVP